MADPISVEAGLREALRAVRDCRKPPRAGQSIHGPYETGESWSVSGLTRLLPQIDAALANDAQSVPHTALRNAAQFLCDRLDNLEWMDGELDRTAREFFGHVDPAHERLKSLLATHPETVSQVGGAAHGQPK